MTALLVTAFAWGLLAARARWPRLSLRQRQVFSLAAFLAAAAGGARLLIEAYKNVLHPPEWDLLIFWINGVVASHGGNYYDPALAARLAAPFHPSVSFVREALAAPFLYPPPAIVWFLPLGWFSLPHAALLWGAVQLACLLASLIVLRSVFFEQRSKTDLLFLAALCCLMRGTYLNVVTAQTVFLLLLFVALALRRRNSFDGGCWLALAMLVKPFVAVLLLYPIFFRKWRSLLGSLLTLLLFSFGALLAFGREVFVNYTKIDFAHLPISMYREIENQSLLAWILRLTGSQSRLPVLYLAMVAVLGVVLLWRLRLTVGRQLQWAAFSLLLAFGILVYPASLRSYTVLLIVPVLVLYSEGCYWLAALSLGLMEVYSGQYMALATLTILIALFVKLPSFRGAPARAAGGSEFVSAGADGAKPVGAVKYSLRA